MENFDLRKFLAENKLTAGSREMEEARSSKVELGTEFQHNFVDRGGDILATVTLKVVGDKNYDIRSLIKGKVYLCKIVESSEPEGWPLGTVYEFTFDDIKHSL